MVFYFIFLILPAEFEDDPDLYVLKPIKYVGIEVWQVRFHEFNFSIEGQIQILASMKNNVDIF